MLSEDGFELSLMSLKSAFFPKPCKSPCQKANNCGFLHYYCANKVEEFIPSLLQTNHASPTFKSFVICKASVTFWEKKRERAKEDFFGEARKGSMLIFTLPLKSFLGVNLISVMLEWQLLVSPPLNFISSTKQNNCNKKNQEIIYTLVLSKHKTMVTLQYYKLIKTTVIIYISKDNDKTINIMISKGLFF